MSSKTLYYFAVGGTGALTVEPLLLLCAAGLGPPRLALSLIDADAANPAFTRAQSLVAAYNDVRRGFGKPSSGFFATELIRTERSDTVWSPLGGGAMSNANMSLEAFVERQRMTGPNADAATLFDLLFTPAQQKEQLHEGFRGNPAIGSVLMHGLKEAKYFKELMNGAKQDTDAVFFATGSVFGGTGASALPVLAELLAGEGIASSRIGAALVTPYYSLLEPSQTESQDGRLKPDSSVFLRNTAAALPTYTKGQSRYGTLYVVGDDQSLPQVRRTYAAGGDEQKNDPHGVEMYAALASLDFLREGRAMGVRYIVAADKDLTWEALPLDLEAKEQLLTFLVAANFYLQYFGATRNPNRQQDLAKELAKQAWMGHIGLKPDFVNRYARELDMLGRYFAAAWGYFWAASANYLPLRVASFDAQAETKIAAPTEYARTHAESVSTITLPRVDNCIHARSPRRKKTLGVFRGGEDRLTSLAEMFNWFNQVQRSDVKDLAGLLTYLREGTARFVKEWYV